MDLFDEEILKSKKKKETTVKPSTIILTAIILLVILCVVIVMIIVYLKGTILTITLDGKLAKELENIFIFEENDNIYMPIKRMAEYLGYGAYNGDYITKSEDETKCYIETEGELVSFTLNSNILMRVVDGQLEQIKIMEPIKEINGELCITAEGAQDAFNFKFYHIDNEIIIQTLEYLYTGYYSNALLEGYLEIEDESFANKTAILDGMLIVKSENNKYGVITIEGEKILETKYDSIQYYRETTEFLVTSNNKKGIMTVDKKTKIELSYDKIEIVKNKNDIFYVVGKSNLYGILDEEGKTIIYPEYSQIGIDVSRYEENGVTNGYILCDQIIPVMKNNQWALFDITGSRITEFIYESLGCHTNKVTGTVAYGVIVVPDYELIVVEQEGKYNLITLEGKGLFNEAILDSVYITISSGKNIYYITSGNTTKELITFLQENGITKPILSE